MKNSMPVMRPCATMPKIAALMPNVGERRDAEHHEAHVRDRRERDQALHVRLRETAERAVDDADHREQADPRRPALAPPRAGSAARCG